MKKLYHYSKQHLQYIEIKSLRVKIAALLGSSFLVIGAVITGVYLIFSSFVNPGDSYLASTAENRELKKKLDEISILYSQLNKELDTLINSNNSLRLTSNLPSYSEEERRVGVGGGYYDNNIDFSTGYLNNDIKKIATVVDEVTRKIEFEKANYREIASKIKENKILFASIPAIKPCEGVLAEDSYGMRVHPILRIKKMHDGIDIITDIGTKVKASGMGVVDYVGRKGGYGLVIEIDHGFGYRSIYAHLSSADVRVGQKVKRGDLIAKTGNSGLSSGPHLHYEIIHDGVKHNPAEFFFDDVNFL